MRQSRNIVIYDEVNVVHAARDRSAFNGATWRAVFQYIIDLLGAITVERTIIYAVDANPVDTANKTKTEIW